MDGVDLAHLRFSQILTDDVLSRFVPQGSLGYYRDRFARIIELSGLADQAVGEIARGQLARRLLWMPIRARLPWTRGSLFNWAAFLGVGFWVAWRRIAGAWWILAALGIAIAIRVTAEDWLQVGAASKVAAWVWPFLFALFGTELLFVRIVAELRCGKIRKRPSSRTALALAPLILLGPAVVVGLVHDAVVTRQGADCKGAPSLAPGSVIHACTVLIEAARTNTELSKAHFIRGLAHWRRNELAPAIDDYTQAVRLDARYALAYYYRGLALQRKGESERAIEDYGTAVQINPQMIEALLMRGNAHESRGQHREALDDYERAIRADPKYKLAYNNAGIVHLRLGAAELAAEEFERAIELDPAFADAYDNLGLAYRAEGDFDHAIANYTRAIEINAKNPLPLVNRGAVYTRKGEHQAALEDFNAALRLDPRAVLALYGRGLVRSKLGNPDGDADMTAAAKLRPDVAAAFARLVEH